MHKKLCSVLCHCHVIAAIDATEAPSNGVQLEPIVWAVIGFVVGVTVTVTLCLLLFICCYCTCFTARKEKRKKHAGMESMMVENPGAAGTWMGSLEAKHGIQSFSNVDSIDFTTFSY